MTQKRDNDRSPIPSNTEKQIRCKQHNACPLPGNRHQRKKVKVALCSGGVGQAARLIVSGHHLRHLHFLSIGCLSLCGSVEVEL